MAHLHVQRDTLAAKCSALEEALDSVLDYVSSPKYYADNMCNTNDIVLRIREHKRAIQLQFED